MKGTIFTAVLICSAILAACSPAAPGKPWLNTDVRPVSCRRTADETSDEAYHKITAEEAKQMMDEGNATVVDVRTAEEYAAGHIPGSILIPVESIGDTKPVELPDTEAVLWSTAAPVSAANALRTSWWNWATNMYMILAELWTGPMKQ